MTPKVMEVLCCLASHHNDVVSREHLLEEVWPGVVVNEDVLTRAISDLRKALEDAPQTPIYVETIPKRGYRIVAPVRFDVPGDSVPSQTESIDVRIMESAKKPRPIRSGSIVVIFMLVVAMSVLIWAFRPDDASRTENQGRLSPLTSLSGAEVDPALSPDGKQVAFAWQGPEGDNWDIYTMLVAGGTPLRLTNDKALERGPTWSPDGNRIAFMRHDGETCSILVISALGGSERVPASCGANVTMDLDWSPDGNWLVFADKPDPAASYGLVLVSPETGERRSLTSPGRQHWGDSGPAFSPDGTAIAFKRSVSMDTQDLYVMLLDGSPPRKLTTESSPIRGVTWTQDGSNIIMSSGLGGAMGLWQIPTDGSVPIRMNESGNDAWEPDLVGSRMVFEQHRPFMEIAVVETDGSVRDLPVNSTRRDIFPAVSPEGTRIAFISDRTGTPELWLSALDGSDPVRLTSFGGPFVGSPGWSPDGNTIAFDARPEGEADIYMVGSEGGIPIRVTDNPAGDIHPTWSAGGTKILFGSNRSGRWEIWSVEPGSGILTPLTKDGGYAPLTLPRTESVVYSRFDEPGLWILKPDGSTRTFELEGPAVHSSWTSNGTFAWILDQETITRIDLESGRSTTTPVPGAVATEGLSVSQDGHQVYFVRAGSQESDLMLMDFRDDR